MANSPEMIRNSFLFVPGVGYKTEQRLWRSGIASWTDIESALLPARIAHTKWTKIKDYVSGAHDALKRRDPFYFAQNLPQNEYWRLYKDFRDKTLFLDIETTGLSRYYDDITLVGTFDGQESRIFVKDNNLPEFAKMLRNYPIIVTFNGKLFDVPFIRDEFPGLEIPPIHIDLRFLLRSIGLTGPLKEIEKKMGISRGKELARVGGRHAAILWREFLRGDDEAFRKLVLYNLSDTMNLKVLMDYCYVKKFQQNIFPLIRQTRFKPKPSANLFRTTERLFRSSWIEPSSRRLSLSSTDRFLHLFSGKSVLVKVDKSAIQRREIAVDTLIDRVRKNGKAPLVVGIDLSGSEQRPTGICILDDNRCDLSVSFTDKEIIEKTMAANPSVVSIDSPLSLPRGRTCVSDDCRCRRFGITRDIERILKKRGVNIYPSLIRSMQKLTQRGMKLSETLGKHGKLVIESYPGAAQDILGFPRKRVNLDNLRIDLLSTGIIPTSETESVSHHEIDALTSALVGYFFLGGMFEAIGSNEEGYLIIPDLSKSTNTSASIVIPPHQEHTALPAQTNEFQAQGPITLFA